VGRGHREASSARRLAPAVAALRPKQRGEEPEDVLLTDGRLVGAVVCWAVVAATLIGLG
jgi:hypothetical protein